MSNECKNWIEIIGDKDVITRMFELVKSEARDWGKEPSPKLTEDENRKWLCLEFDFRKAHPYPDKYAKMDAEKKGSGYRAGGKNWMIENWESNSPSNASTGFINQENLEQVEGFHLSDYNDPACAVIEFTTAWAPVWPVTAALSRQYPELTFKHSYEEWGLLGAGYKVWKAGILLKEFEDENGDDEQEGDYEEQHNRR